MHFLISPGTRFINIFAVWALLFTINTPTLNASFAGIDFAKIKLLPVTGIASFALGAYHGLKESDPDAYLKAATFGLVQVGTTMTALQAFTDTAFDSSQGTIWASIQYYKHEVTNFPWFSKTYGANVTGYVTGYMLVCCCREMYKKSSIKKMCADNPKLTTGLLLAATTGITALGIYYVPAPA